MKWHRFSIFVVSVFFLGEMAAPLGAVFAQGELMAQGGIFAAYAVQPGDRVEVPVEIRDVADLYAVDLEIHFDPAVVQVEDANPSMDGVQPALGTFLEAGLALYSTVDNEAGVVRFAMSQVNPAEAKSGSGVVLILCFTGGSEGESDLTVSVLDLSTRSGEAIPVEAVDGSVEVSADAAASVGTSIPAQEQGALIEIPTFIPSLMPTPTPTEAPQPTPTPTAVLSADERDGTVSEDQAEQAATQDASRGEGFSILDYWWVVLIVVSIVVALGVYLVLSRR